MINAVRMSNPSFKQRYVNSDNTVVNVDRKAVLSARRQLEIRSVVEKSIKESDNPELKQGDVFFTIFSDGSCKLTKKDALPVYTGQALNVNMNNSGKWKAQKIFASSVYGHHYLSDEAGAVRANGTGSKYAYINPNGDIYICKNASDLFPDK